MRYVEVAGERLSVLGLGTGSSAPPSGGTAPATPAGPPAGVRRALERPARYRGDVAYLRPNALFRAVNPLVARLGLASQLRVRGRRSGEWRTASVNVLELGGARYLVAPRGEAHWVRNLRAAGEGELRQRGHRLRFRAAELAPAERPPVIAAYRERWNWQVKAQFDALPEAADHPVFRLTPIA